MLSARQLPFLAGAGLLLAALACLAMLSGHNDELLEVQRAAPPRMSSLMWIAAPNTNTPNDFMEFRNNCLAACSAAQLDQSKCYTQVRRARGVVVGLRGVGGRLGGGLEGDEMAVAERVVHVAGRRGSFLDVVIVLERGLLGFSGFPCSLKASGADFRGRTWGQKLGIRGPMFSAWAL
ncbi:hypothetical protein T484DRAFT_2541101 [Baffinella frigidus]|nr:hypothetical protein T484DRAFT_2541101 [Cryptophyta sp. CCMP2293]